MSNSNEADLPPNLACLKPIDTLLRCPICFDFLNISMMTQCSHNFCSLCIRKFLSYKLLCPVCNTPMTEQDLRNNRILDEVVQSFQSARQLLSRANFESPPISPKTPSVALKGKAARQKCPRKEGTPLTHFFQKRTSATTPSSGAQADLMPPCPVKEEPMEVCVQPPRDLKQERVEAKSTRVKEEKMDVSAFPSTSQVSKAIAKVECPVCEVAISQQHINKHLDACLSRDEKKEGLRSSARRRPMSKLVYTLMTIPELKRRLRDCHLSTQGSREQLIRRHQEFTHIFNAQCDALNPRSGEDIAREVENNEKTRNQLGSKSKPAIPITKKQTAEEIEQLNSNYRKQHSSEFSHLIAQVRGRLETSRRTQMKQEEEKKPVEALCSGGNNSIIISIRDRLRSKIRLLERLYAGPGGPESISNFQCRNSSVCVSVWDGYLLSAWTLDILSIQSRLLTVQVQSPEDLGACEFQINHFGPWGEIVQFMSV